jgi:hypothetical protein
MANPITSDFVGFSAFSEGRPLCSKFLFSLLYIRSLISYSEAYKIRISCDSAITTPPFMNNNNNNKKLKIITKKSRLQKQRRNVDLQKARLLSGKVASRQTSEVVPNYGKQLGSIVQKGYGGTLRMYPSTLHFAQVYANPFLLFGA